MRDDIDPQKPLVKLLLVNRNTYKLANGTTLSEGDYNGYRAVMRAGETRVILATAPGDMSYDWLDVTDDAKAGHFIVAEREA
jgi:hypothetical protein